MARQARIPSEARIAVVTEKEIVPETEVREKFRRVKPLKEISVKQRGWTLDVLNIVLGSAPVPVAVRDVSLRTFPKRIRRDAGRRARDARAPRDNPENNSGQESARNFKSFRLRSASSRRAAMLGYYFTSGAATGGWASNSCFTGSRTNTRMVNTPSTVPKGINMHSMPAMTRQNM